MFEPFLAHVRKDAAGTWVEHALLHHLQLLKQNNAGEPARAFSVFTVTVPPAGLLAAFPRVTLERIVG